MLVLGHNLMFIYDNYDVVYNGTHSISKSLEVTQGLKIIYVFTKLYQFSPYTRTVILIKNSLVTTLTTHLKQATKFYIEPSSSSRKGQVFSPKYILNMYM